MIEKLKRPFSLDRLTKEELKETRERLSTTEERLSDVEDKLDETQVDLSVVQDKLDISVEDRAVKPIDKNKVNRIAILRSIEDSNIYYLTCGQRDSVQRVIKRKEDTHILIETICDVPNSIYLFDHVKNALGSNAKAFKRVVKLIKIDQFTFIDIIKSLFDGRRNIDLSKRP